MSRLLRCRNNLWAAAAALGAHLFVGCGPEPAIQGPATTFPEEIEPSYDFTLSLVAGRPGGEGTRDGHGAQARFGLTRSVAFGPNGDVFVSDYAGTIRRVDSNGVVTTFAGSAQQLEHKDGPREEARFRSPRGLAFDAAGNLFVADTEAHTIRRIDTSGNVTTVAGAANEPGSLDGVGTQARLRYPEGLSIAPDGSLWIADSGNSSVRRMAPDGTLATVAGTSGDQGARNGPAAFATFKLPTGIFVTEDHTVFVADPGNHLVRVISPSLQVSTFAGVEGVDGTTLNGDGRFLLKWPTGVVALPGGDVFVTSTYGYALHRFERASGEGQVIVEGWASGAVESPDGIGVARLRGPRGLAVEPGTNRLILCDGELLRRVVPKLRETTSVATIAGEMGHAVSTDAANPLDARFTAPGRMTRMPNGSVALIDGNAVRVLNPGGVVSTLAGVPDSSGYRDGPGYQARFSNPNDLAAAPDGSLFVSECGNHLVRRIRPDGVVSTVAGTPNEMGFANGPSSSAKFACPVAVALAADGGILVGDMLNTMVRRIAADGTVSTLHDFGRPEQFMASDWSKSVLDLVVEPDGSIVTGHPDSIRRISPDGQVTILAGQPGSPGYLDGTGANARVDLLGLAQLTRTGDGRIYFTAPNKSVVRVLSREGEVKTVLGTPGVSGFASGDSPGLNRPSGLLADDDGALLVSDAVEHVLVRATPRTR